MDVNILAFIVDIHTDVNKNITNRTVNDTGFYKKDLPLPRMLSFLLKNEFIHKNWRQMCTIDQNAQIIKRNPMELSQTERNL